MNRLNLLLNIYAAMHEALGPSGWWPGESPFEIAVGAILTQNTNWGNVEKAIANLRQENLLVPSAMLRTPPGDLSEIIRPAGFFRLKADRLGAFLAFLASESRAPDDLDRADLAFLLPQETVPLRAKLLAVRGIGRETADSILLYALNKPSFVVDAYTGRIFSRHGLVKEGADYDAVQGYFTAALPRDTALWSEYHALIVRVAKAWCRKKNPRCGDCPLRPFLEHA